MSTVINAPSARRSLGLYGKAALSFDEAVKAVDYRVTKEPLFDADGKELPSEFRGIFNANTRRPLGVAGDGYTFYQPAESLEIMRAAVETINGAKWRSVVVTHGGAHIAAFAQLRTEIKAPKRGDRVGLSFFMRDYFNQKGVHSFGLNAETLACTNGAITSESIFSMSGKHTGSLKDRIEGARLTLAMKVQDEVERLRGFVHRLDSVAMSRNEMDGFSLQLFGLKDESALSEASPQLRSKVETVRELFIRGTGNVGKSRWDAFNAVTEFTDWHGSFRTTDNASADENRFLSILGGPVMKLKDRAAELLLN